MRGNYSEASTATTGAAEQAHSPVLIGTPKTAGNVATLVYDLPTTSVDGQPLAAGAFTKLLAWAKAKGIVGTLEDWVGMDPQGSVECVPGSGQVTVVISGLAFSTEYVFTAAVE